MAGIDGVLERLVADGAFREQLRADPAAALSGYMLYDEDLAVLARALEAFQDDDDHGTRPPMSQSAFRAAITGLVETSSGGSPTDAPTPSGASDGQGQPQ